MSDDLLTLLTDIAVLQGHAVQVTALTGGTFRHSLQEVAPHSLVEPDPLYADEVLDALDDRRTELALVEQRKSDAVERGLT